MRRLLSITLVLTLATVASACGGGDDESSGPEDFAVQADAICEEVNRESPPPTEAPRSAQEAIDLETDEIEIRQGLDARLRELQPPEHLQPVFDDYNAQTAEVIDLNEQAREAAEDGDEKRYGEVGQQRLEALEARERTAEQLGFEVCGRQMEASPEAAPSEPVPPDER